MRLVKPSVEHVDVTTDPIKAIERIGRVCYKSEDKITDESAPKFVQMLMDRGHEAMIEHSNFILSIDSTIYEALIDVPDREFINLSRNHGNGCLVSGNPRAFRELCMRPDLDSNIQRVIALTIAKKAALIMDDTLRYTEHMSSLDTAAAEYVKLFEDVDSLSTGERTLHDVASYRIVCDRGVTHEIVRHRPFSYAQESTRYCNYKGGVTFVIPPWVIIPEEKIDQEHNVMPIELTSGGGDNPDGWWWSAMDDAEHNYKALLGHGWIPQQARSVLPNSLKTEIVVTGNLLRWKHFFKMRCSKKAHPQMQEVANMILADIRERVPVIFDANYEELDCKDCVSADTDCSLRDSDSKCNSFKAKD